MIINKAKGGQQEKEKNRLGNKTKKSSGVLKFHSRTMGISL